MTIAILSGLAAALAIGAALLAWSRARRVARLTSGAARELEAALKRVPESGRAAELERRARPGSWEHALAQALLGAADDATRIVVVNDALLDLEHALQHGASWPRAAIRIALAGDLACALAAWLATREVRAPVILVAIGGAAALVCVEAGRSAARHVEAQRRDVDALITVLVGGLADLASPLPQRRGLSSTRPSRRRRSL